MENFNLTGKDDHAELNAPPAEDEQDPEVLFPDIRLYARNVFSGALGLEVDYLLAVSG